jgi:hypothetical protein
MSARHQPSPLPSADLRVSVRLSLSIRHEIDATLFGRVEAARHEPEAVLSSAEELWPIRSLSAEALSTRGAPFAFVSPSDFRLATGTASVINRSLDERPVLRAPWRLFAPPRPMSATGVRRDRVQAPPGNRSSRKQSEQSWRQRSG